MIMMSITSDQGSALKQKMPLKYLEAFFIRINL
jgi:hypothetical protein